MLQKSMNKHSCIMLIIILCFSTEGYYCSNSSNMQCNSSIAECDAEGEMLMQSDVARRFLEEGKHISFGALARDQPVCGGARGQAYSNNANCLPPQQNPYHRGCSKYYRCKRDD
ncbi:protein RALF-like 32 [Silene latifolia]|uniref:protein RALF-like 32 n=1 Tax=Silene latifolia TaxID=37657 RepID=UPI003D781B9A